MSIPRGSHAVRGSQRAASPPGGPGRAPRWEAAAAEVISCAWPRAARRASAVRTQPARRGAAATAGAGFVRSSGDLPGSDLGPPRPPRPLLRRSGDPAASRHSGRATAGRRSAWRLGSRRDSRQLTQVSRAGPEGRGLGGLCRRERAFGGADGADSSRRGGQFWSRCLPTWEPRDGRRLPGASAHPRWEAVTVPSCSRSCHWGPARSSCSWEGPRDVRAGFLPPRCSPALPFRSPQRFVLGCLLM